MKLPFRGYSPLIIALAALFLAFGGGAVAANHYLITSTKQIKPSVLKALKGAKGPRGHSKALRGREVKAQPVRSVPRD